MNVKLMEIAATFNKCSLANVRILFHHNQNAMLKIL
jgi:hypothetical protein